MSSGRPLTCIRSGGYQEDWGLDRGWNPACPPTDVRSAAASPCKRGRGLGWLTLLPNQYPFGGAGSVTRWPVR